MNMCFIPHTFYNKAKDLVAACNAICTTYFEKGYGLTLRQLFYQLVSTGKIPNTVKAYELLGKTVTDARYAGELDWEHITDRVRVLQETARWIDAKDRLTHAAKTLRIDTLCYQKFRPEVWIEKDALIELAANVCTAWDVPYIAVKAYNSASAIWEARKRFMGYLEQGQTPLILHLGDFDFTGDDCSRFLRDRMRLMTGHEIAFKRLALNPDQIDHYDLPPQPGKVGDPRFKAHIKKHEEWLREYGKTHKELVDPMMEEARQGRKGGQVKDDDIAFVWELDALAPDVIEQIINDGIADVIDTDERGVFLDLQTEYANRIAEMAENYDIITSDGFKTWGVLQDAEYMDVTPNLGIPIFHPSSNSKPNLGTPRFAAEMNAVTAEEYYSALFAKTHSPANPLSFWSNWSKLP